MQDCVLYMRDWAEVSGFDLKLLVRMERDILRLLNWNVCVAYDQYLGMIEDSKRQLALAVPKSSVAASAAFVAVGSGAAGVATFSLFSRNRATGA
jgi:hypothetical protein